MKATELRIGNWYTSVKFGVPVQCELTDLSQLCVMSDGAYTDPPIEEMFEPIPLTEEWLLKFGFDYDNETSTYSLLTSLRKCDLCIDILLSDGEYFWKYVELKYVHQLQNLYFALTGNELEIK